MLKICSKLELKNNKRELYLFGAAVKSFILVGNTNVSKKIQQWNVLDEPIIQISHHRQKLLFVDTNSKN